MKFGVVQLELHLSGVSAFRHNEVQHAVRPPSNKQGFGRHPFVTSFCPVPSCMFSNERFIN